MGSGAEHPPSQHCRLQKAWEQGNTLLGISGAALAGCWRLGACLQPVTHSDSVR